MNVGFDNGKYLAMQSEHIRERIAQFGGKLYLEFGGKLFDDYHAARVLPGFAPDSKVKMLLQLKDQAEIVIVINATDIEKNNYYFDALVGGLGCGSHGCRRYTCTHLYRRQRVGICRRRARRYVADKM